MTNEQKILLKALKDHLQGNSSEIPADVNMNELQDLAKKQQFEGILYYQTHHEQFHGAFAAYCYRSVERKQMLKRIHASFTENGIEYLFFKGPEIAKYYPCPELRSMGDLDILVRLADKEKAHEALLSIGCVTDTDKPENHEWIYFYNRNEIELHDRLLYSGAASEAEFTAFTDTAWENVIETEKDSVRYCLPPEFLFLFTLLHLRKHLLWSGIGLRQFYDLAVMIRNARMDWEYLREKLTALQLYDFALVCFALIKRWFAVETPLPPYELSDKRYETLTNEVLSGGVFGILGTDDSKMYTLHVASSLYGEKHKRAKQLKMMLQFFFPGYEAMKVRYPEMARSRLLLPLMWVRRAIDAVKNRHTKGGMEVAIKPLSVELEKIEDQEAMLAVWGLETQFSKEI